MSTTLDTPEILRRSVAEVLPDAQSLAEKISTQKIRVFLGIDPTGSELTLGHSIPLRKLQQFADMGHHAILLIGNGTVKIGDPTGRDSTRPQLTDEEIERNFQNWKQQASKILDFNKIEIRYNADWLDTLTYTDIISLLAKTTVQQLTERDMFQARMEKGLPIFGHEILYPMLQGYDSVAMDIDLEIGGTDQTFNMLMGRTLQKAFNNKQKWVLSTPIINGTDGRKMSKSYGNYVGLTEEPTTMYAKLMRIADEQIIEYFTLLTDISESSIVQIKQALLSGENPMQYKKMLAKTITEMYHDTVQANEAEKNFEKVVQSNEIPENIPEISINGPTQLIEVLKKCQPGESSSQLRRIVEQSGVQLFPSEERPSEIDAIVDPSIVSIVKIGKRKFFRLTEI